MNGSEVNEQNASAKGRAADEIKPQKSEHDGNRKTKGAKRKDAHKTKNQAKSGKDKSRQLHFAESSGSNASSVAFKKLELNEKLEEMMVAVNGYKHNFMHQGRGKDKVAPLIAAGKENQPARKELPEKGPGARTASQTTSDGDDGEERKTETKLQKGRKIEDLLDLKYFSQAVDTMKTATSHNDDRGKDSNQVDASLAIQMKHNRQKSSCVFNEVSPIQPSKGPDNFQPSNTATCLQGLRPQITDDYLGYQMESAYTMPSLCQCGCQGENGPETSPLVTRREAYNDVKKQHRLHHAYTDDDLQARRHDDIRSSQDLISCHSGSGRRCSSIGVEGTNSPAPCQCCNNASDNTYYVVGAFENKLQKRNPVVTMGDVPHGAPMSQYDLQQNSNVWVASSIGKTANFNSNHPESVSALKRQKRSMSGQDGLIAEYQAMFERLKWENENLHDKLDEKCNELDLVVGRLKESQANSAVQERIEQQLKERLRSMQNDLHEANREKYERLQQEQQLSNRVHEMQAFLIEIESELEVKDTEIKAVKEEKQGVIDELRRSQEERSLIKQQYRDLEVGHVQSQEYVATLESEIQEIDESNSFYKEKYEELTKVLETCRAQIKEFDQVNAMSNSVIERYEKEIEQYRYDVRRLNEQMDLEQKQYFELLQKNNMDNIKLQAQMVGLSPNKINTAPNYTDEKETLAFDRQEANLFTCKVIPPRSDSVNTEGTLKLEDFVKSHDQKISQGFGTKKHSMHKPSYVMHSNRPNSISVAFRNFQVLQNNHKRESESVRFQSKNVFGSKSSGRLNTIADYSDYRSGNLITERKEALSGHTSSRKTIRDSIQYMPERDSTPCFILSSSASNSRHHQLGPDNLRTSSLDSGPSRNNASGFPSTSRGAQNKSEVRSETLASLEANIQRLETEHAKRLQRFRAKTKELSQFAFSETGSSQLPSDR